MTDLTNILSGAAAKAGFTETGTIETSALQFYPEIRQICEGNSCRNYGASWACPPAVGTLEECQRRLRKYGTMLLFSKKYELDDSFDFEGMEHGLHDFKCAVDIFAETIKSRGIDCLILSNEGCGRCSVCTYPHEPCRFPDRLYPSIEGFGLIVSELAQQAGIHYNNGPNTVTFFGGILY